MDSLYFKGDTLRKRGIGVFVLHNFRLSRKYNGILEKWGKIVGGGGTTASWVI